MKNFIIAIGIGLALISCNQTSTNKTEEIAQRYFDVYSARQDYNQLKSFYNDSVQYENVIQNTSLNQYETGYLLNQIFSFNDKSMVYDDGKMINVEQIVSNDSMAIVNGTFNSYTYNGFKFTPMKFTTYLYFDENHKIKKQVDWFNYPIGDLIELYQLEQSKSIDLEKK